MSCNSEYRTLKDYMAWTSIPCPRNPLSELFFVIFYMIAFFILLRWFMGIKTHLSNSSRLWNYTASQERKQIKEYFSLFPMTFEWYLWLADIMLSHWLIPSSMTFKSWGGWHLTFWTVIQSEIELHIAPPTRPPDLPLEKFVCRSGSNS